MNHENNRTGITAWLLSVAMAMGGIGCLTSAFGLDTSGLVGVFLCCLIVTGFSSLCFSFRWGGTVFLCTAAFVGSWLFREGFLLLSLESLLFQITWIYDQAYDFGVIRWSGEYLWDVPIRNALSFCACLCSIPASYAICRGKNLVLPVLLGLAPLFACMVVLDTVPGELWLMLLIVSLLLMILPQTVRRLNRQNGQRLTALLMVPVMLFSLVIFTVIPKEGNETHLDNMRNSVMGWISSLPFVHEGPDGMFYISFNGDSEDYMNLLGVGPKNELSYAVMDIVSTRSQHLYLRGQSFDTYDGTSWSASNESNPTANWPVSDQLSVNANITITLRGSRSYYYLPYYLLEMPQLVRGKAAKSKGLKEYSFLTYSLRSDSELVKGFLPSNCLKLPDSTRRAADDYINRNLFVGEFAGVNFETVESLATAIGKIVERSASYSLNTPRMPDGKSDFAMWFLEESDTGYCVHFATAAAVLLRSQGIPARFVSGYTCQTRMGRRITVNSNQAHAWVEYYDSDIGCWRVLDPTPAGNGGGTNPGTSVTVPPVSTRPTEPTPPTETTAPTEPTVTEPIMTLPNPTAPTKPTETTAPATKPTVAPTAPTGGGTIPGGSGSTWDPAKFWQAIRPYVLGLLQCLCVAGTLAGQYLLRRYYRKRKMHTGHHNRRALFRWRYALRIGTLIGAEPPERLLHLAEKAKFSQHTLTAGELQEFDLWIAQGEKALRAMPWYRRILIRLIWAI